MVRVRTVSGRARLWRECSEFRVQGLEAINSSVFSVQCSEFGVQGFERGVKGSGLTAWLMVWGVGFGG